MNCLNCSSEFDAVNHVPRLLPHCGHTLCSVCINRLINSNFIICTECNELNMAFKESDLPKNLAILRIQNESKRQLSSEQNSQCSISSTPSQNNQKVEIQEKCAKHSKKLQAFCLECFEYVCLQCVISHPKQHELKTFQQAVGYFKEQTKKIIKFYREMKLNYKMQRIQLEKTDLLSTINLFKSKIAKIFSEMKSYLEQKQTQALANLKTIYDQQMNRIAVQEKQVESLLSCYNKLVEVSHTNSLRFCVNTFIDNKTLFNFGKQKQFFQNIVKREKSVNNKTELAGWEQSFNKFKEKVAKQLKCLMEIRQELKEKPLGQYKNNASVNNINKSVSKKEPAKLYKVQPKKENKELHISLKELDKFVQVDTQKIIPTSTSNASRVLVQRSPVLLFGGYTEDEDSPGMEIYGQYGGKVGKFSKSTGHVKFGIISIGTKVFIFGGKKDNRRISEVYMIDPLKGQSKQWGHLTRAKSGFGYCRKGSICYVVGGNDGNILQDFEQYDFINHGFRPGLPKLTIARDELTAVIHKNEIFAIGGYNLDNELSLNVVERYSFEGRKWSIAAPLVIQRRSHGSISLDSGLYVVGGYDGRNYLSTVERYNEIQCRWQIVCEMMEQRCTFGIVENTKSDGFYVFGGFAHQALSTCQLFCSEARKCMPMQSLKSKRFMLAAIQAPWES